MILTEFLDNKYKNWYFSIIENAKNRTYDSSFYEKHHIIPSSLGGSDNLDNIVCLLFKEHFICHWLLTKFTTSSSKGKMCSALRMMMNSSSTNRRVLTSGQYEIARTALSRIKRKMSDEFKQKQSDSKKGNLNPMFGKKQSEKQKQKARENMLLNSSNIREKIIIANKKRKGIEHKKIQCPFCDKVGSVSNMKRWHFNNCKKVA